MFFLIHSVELFIAYDKYSDFNSFVINIQTEIFQFSNNVNDTMKYKNKLFGTKETYREINNCQKMYSKQ